MFRIQACRTFQVQNFITRFQSLIGEFVAPCFMLFQGGKRTGFQILVSIVFIVQYAIEIPYGIVCVSATRDELPAP